MSSTDVVVREKGEIVRLDSEQIEFLANTEFVPDRIRGNLPAIFATIATGREIGIGDMASLRHIHIIDGKPGYSAEIMAARVRQEGHSIVGEVTDTYATVTGTRGDTGDTITYTFTIEMARRIQARVKGGGTIPLAEKEAWRNFPESMLWARAVSQLCRMLFSDCLAGATYTPEELETVEEPTPTIDMSDPDIPFGDYPAEQLLPPAPSEVSPPSPASEGAPKPPSAAMLKKLNVLVGKLRPAHLSTLQLWQSMGREPVPSEDGMLHWSPLRDSLTWQEAHDLIDRLDSLTSAVPAVPLPDPTAGQQTLTDDEVTEIVALATKLMVYAESNGDEHGMRGRIDKDATDKEPRKHLEWLRRQSENLDRKLGAVA